MGFLKNRIIRSLAPYQYPQVVFGREILKTLEKHRLNKAVILDCPCGNGEVSYHLSKLKNATVTGVDIDQDSVNMATKNFRRQNLAFEKADIFEFLEKKDKYDGICLVNSLFLLPDHDKLLSLMHACLRDEHSLLIIITPNPESDNFKAFQDLHPSINKIILNTTDFETKARQMCFTLTAVKEIGYANYYGRNELKFFSVFAPFYLLALNFFKNLVKANGGNYIMYCFTKNYEKA